MFVLFQDPIHRTLASVGQGDIGGLLDDYNHTTILRHNRLLTTCKQLEAAYTHVKYTGELPERLASIIPPLPTK